MLRESELAGKTLGNRYDVLELIGAGGMGTVYRARDRELDDLVALKVIRSELANDDAIIERFRREVKLARRVTHRNVARTFELGHADGLMFCTMELVEGESLTRRLRRLPRLSTAEVVGIAGSLCEALTAAHAVDVIHRDIKPDNVLIAAGGRIVLADFGIASVRVDVRSDLSGTPAYMAPEQARGEPATPATDVYAVGVLLYEMLTNTVGFTGTITQILEDKQRIERLAIPASVGIDAELARVIADATARDLTARISTAAELHARLTRNAAHVDAPLEPHVAWRECAELHTVVIREPRPERPDALLYLADAVHERLLRRLNMRPRLRVIVRTDELSEPGATIVTLSASDTLTVEVATGDSKFELRLPLVASHIDRVAKLATNAILAGINLSREASPEDAREAEAVDLLLRAQFIAQRDIGNIADAIVVLERARVLLPDDPRIAASLASAQARRAFFATDLSGELLARSREHVQIALAAGPRLAESHLAAGHLELSAGEASVAAAHYRIAIACAPHLAEAHESLGRMLLEAGFIDRALARLEEALAIRPSFQGIRWDIARAYALEGRWADHDRAMTALEARQAARPARTAPLRLRFALWRGNHAEVAAVRDELGAEFDEILPRSAILPVFLEAAWPTHRDELVARALATSPVARRRRSFIAQLVAEAAGFSGDAETAIAMITVAIDSGLFDLHWLDRCPLLACVRASTAFPEVRRRVQTRADAILDALYGDHAVQGLSDTVAASLP